MGWHQNQIDLLGMGALDNVMGRIAFSQDSLHRELAQLFTEK
jgi:hypothetical protein